MSTSAVQALDMTLTMQKATQVHIAPYTLHPTPCTLHPAPYTLQPTPCTLHPAPYTLKREEAAPSIFKVLTYLPQQ